MGFYCEVCQCAKCIYGCGGCASSPYKNRPRGVRDCQFRKCGCSDFVDKDNFAELTVITEDRVPRTVTFDKQQLLNFLEALFDEREE